MVKKKAAHWKKQLGLEEPPDAELLALLESTPDGPVKSGNPQAGEPHKESFQELLATLQAAIASQSLKQMLVEARKDSGKSLAEVGQVMGVSRGRVSHIEQSENLEVATLVNMADAIGYDVLVTLVPRKKGARTLSTKLPGLSQ